MTIYSQPEKAGIQATDGPEQSAAVYHESGLRTRRFRRGTSMTVTAMRAVTGAAALFPVPEDRADGQSDNGQQDKNDNQVTQNRRHRTLP